MADLIDRQALRLMKTEECAGHSIEYAMGWKACIEWIRALPSAQPEQKVGKWQITECYPHNVYCSVCHTKFAQTHWTVWEDGSLPRKYCPSCGAKMEEHDGIH